MGYRIVRMSNELFEQLFTEGYTIPANFGERLRVTKGLPPGAKLVGVSSELFFNLDQVALKFSHPSWEESPAGHAIPEAEVTYGVETAPKSAFNATEG